MFCTAPDGLRTARKIKVGGVGHFGEYCVVKYSRNSYTVFPAGYLFSPSHRVCTGDIVTCVSKVYTLSGNNALYVVIDNN